MEKRKPTYNLAAFKNSNFEITRTATLTAAEQLGYIDADIRRIVKTMEESHFRKSMTSMHNHLIWQDVYYVPSDEGLLYVKFCSGSCTEFTLLSFKKNTST